MLTPSVVERVTGCFEFWKAYGFDRQLIRAPAGNYFPNLVEIILTNSYIRLLVRSAVTSAVS